MVYNNYIISLSPKIASLYCVKLKFNAYIHLKHPPLLKASRRISFADCRKLAYEQAANEIRIVRCGEDALTSPQQYPIDYTRIIFRYD